MRFAARSLVLSVGIVLAASDFASGAPENAKLPAAGGETAAEKLRKALDQVRDLEITNQPLDAAVNQLREQTGLNFVLDHTAVPPSPLAANLLGGAAVAGDQAGSYAHLRLDGQFHNQPLRVALTRLLRPHNLAHALVGDTILITTKEKAIDRPLEQPVSLNADAAPLSALLKQLARDTGANLVLDPRAAKEGQATLSLRLDEVPLQTAVDLLADEAGLRAVRMDNLLYVTTEARAEKLRKPAPPTPAAAMGWQVWPDGNGGFRLTPPAGLAPAAGIAGFGGIGGLGALGALGIGGGMVGMAGGAAGPVPLTPGLPKAKQPTPEKPKADTPPAPAKPAAKPAGKDKPAPKDKPQAQAAPPRSPSPRSRRRFA
jgi:hypothetical protein